MRLAVACLVLTGCFYIDPINRLPEIRPIGCRFVTSERPCNSDSYLHRNEAVALSVEVSDPDGRPEQATYDWKAYPCSDAAANECDLFYYESTAEKPLLTWPIDRPSARSISVKLAVRDGRGGRAAGSARFFVNDPPSLELNTAPRSHAIGAPMQLTATYSDVDEGPTNLVIAWEVVAPVLVPPVVLGDVSSVTVGNPAQIISTKRLVPSALGAWDVKVTATDLRAETTERHLRFDVGPDLPPCLVRAQPIVPPDGAVLPIVEPTVFQALLVDDELDAYPRLSSDPAFGTTTFAWSILAPGAAQRQPLVGATGNSIDFDPAGFTPGQRVELRVEIFDRNAAAITCADGAPTCATPARPQCTQRQTWRVEVR